MESLENQSFRLLSVLLLSVDNSALEERGGGQSKAAAEEPCPTPEQKELISQLLSRQPSRPELLEDSVPSHLPEHLKDNIPDVTYQSLAELFDINGPARHVANGTVSSLDVISSYFHSFRNIYDYELSDQGAFHLRFLKYFARLFSEMVEQLCSDKMAGLTLEQFLTKEMETNKKGVKSAQNK